MYFKILKKDLKRKKTMNVILLMFILLAATFISSSVNNLISISTAMDGYFEKAELGDFIIVTMKEDKNDKAISEFLNKESNVERWVVDENLYLNEDNIKLSNQKNFKLSSTGLLSSFNIQQQKFFDSKNNEITSIDDGDIYLPLNVMENNDLKPGDVITFEDDNFSMDFTIVDNCKDAFLGSTMMGTARFIINDTDYNKIKENTKFTQGTIYSVFSSDVEQLQQNYNQKGFNILVSCDQNLIKTTYVMDMVIAGVLLIVSVCLILISMVILRFTIVFTLNEEFREIGIMKAIGIRGRSIRGLYIVKYLAISIIGAAIGFFLSAPFGNMFLKQVSKNVIISSSSGLFINFICSVLIVIVVVLFCYSCTHHINKFTPVDAIRNGSNGERFKRKGFMKLSKSRLSTAFFMAFNDILSAPKKFGVLIITFTIGVILVIVPINTINTLRGDRLVQWFGMAESDVYLVNENQQMKFIAEDGREAMKDYFSTMEKTLLDNGIDASISSETLFKYKISLGDYGYNSFALQGTGITADQYMYMKGQPPEYENEVALTHITADEIGAQIGDTVKIKSGDLEKDYIVTAIYQSMNNMGEGIRFSEKADLDYKTAFSSFAIQIKYQDNPSHKEVEKRFALIEDLYPDFDVFTGGGYLSEMMGNVSNQLESVKQIIVVVIIIINMLVVVLMLKTFIAKEKGEIGMLKCIGFRNTAIIQWQVLRIGIILLISTVLGAVLSNPLGQISSGKVFEMMGASHIEFNVNIFEVYVIYPFVIFVMTLAVSVLASLQIRKITAQETNNIE